MMRKKSEIHLWVENQVLDELSDLSLLVALLTAACRVMNAVIVGAMYKMTDTARPFM